MSNMKDERAFLVAAMAAFLIGFGLIGVMVGKPVSHTATVPVAVSAAKPSPSDDTARTIRYMESIGVDPAQQFNVIRNLQRATSTNGR